jgi:site-specific DNA recombinase
VEPARGLGHLQASRARGAGQRGRLHQSPGHGRAPGPAGPAARRYLLAGLLTCGRCGRRLESAWSHDRSVYRCRHGHTSAAVPDPARPKATYLREDEILPHLAALAILRAESGTPDRARRAGITAPAQIADLIEQLRADGVVLTYDPQDRTLRADGRDTLSVTTGRNH